MPSILDMPESPSQFAEWLDRILMSEELAGLVDDLMVIHEAHDEGISAEDAREWLGEEFPRVMERGLVAISQGRLQQLLKRPSLLPAIQELALVSGGQYWSQVMDGVPLKGPATTPSTEWDWIHGTSTTVVAHAGEASFQEPFRDDSHQSRKRTRRPWPFIVLPIAAAALIAVFVSIDSGREEQAVRPHPKSDLAITRGTDGEPNGENRGQDEPWGWNRTDLLAGMEEPTDIPKRLADTLDEWFTLGKGLDTDPQAFTVQVNELWAGCERFSSESFSGMQPELRQNLRDAVSAFQRRLDAVLANLDRPIAEEEKASVMAAARKSVDGSVKDTVARLRELK